MARIRVSPKSPQKYPPERSCPRCRCSTRDPCGCRAADRGGLQRIAHGPLRGCSYCLHDNGNTGGGVRHPRPLLSAFILALPFLLPAMADATDDLIGCPRALKIVAPNDNVVEHAEPPKRLRNAVTQGDAARKNMARRRGSAPAILPS
jgi:hypothetical protein